jgi:hypothetical protein
MRLLVICFFLSFCTNSFSQTKKVESSGEWPLSKNISFYEANEKALIGAKKEALRKAGISEEIYSTEILTTSSSNENINQNYIKDVFLNIGGVIENWEYIEEPKEIEKDGVKYVKLKIMAKVKKYKTKPDLMLKARVEGLKKSYDSNFNGNDENNYFDITITPYMDCYLRIFYVSDSETSVVFPLEVKDGLKLENEIFEDILLLKNKKKSINYIYPYTEKETENGRFLIIITKKQYPYTESKVDQDGYYSVTYFDKIISWYNNIEPEEKNIMSEQFSISR